MASVYFTEEEEQAISILEQLYRNYFENVPQDPANIYIVAHDLYLPLLRAQKRLGMDKEVISYRGIDVRPSTEIQEGTVILTILSDFENV